MTEVHPLLDDVEAFCRELRPIEDECYLEHRFNDQLIPLARKYHLLGMIVPPQFGGRGIGAVDYTQALVRIGQEGTGVRTFFSGQCSIGQYPILRFGNAAQQQQYLPPSVRGELVLAFGLTEPEAGSNPLEMQSTYRRDGDRFLLTGEKFLITNGQLAGAVIVFAYPEDKTGPERRISAFIVEMSGPSVHRELMRNKLGMYTINTGRFRFEHHPVPLENLLGVEGQGFGIAMATLVSGRLSVAAGCLGVIEDCLAEVVAYSKVRHQHGKPIARHQLVAEHIAMIEVGRAAATGLIREAAQAKAASDAQPGDPAAYAAADQQVAQAKLFASQAAWDAADRAVQIFGGRGWFESTRAGRHLQDVRVCRIYEGTDEILKLKIAAGVLGKEFAAFH